MKQVTGPHLEGSMELEPDLTPLFTPCKDHAKRQEQTPAHNHEHAMRDNLLADKPHRRASNCGTRGKVDGTCECVFDRVTADPSTSRRADCRTADEHVFCQKEHIFCLNRSAHKLWRPQFCM